MTKKGVGIVWMRNDLRLDDHPALYLAGLEYDKLLPIVTFDPSDQFNERQTAWKSDLAASLGITMKKGSTKEILLRSAKAKKASCLAWCAGCTPDECRFDRALELACKRTGIEPLIGKSNTLIDLEEILNRSGEPFKRFSPFYTTAKQLTVKGDSLGRISPSRFLTLPSDPIDHNAFTYAYWTPEEKRANHRLKDFLSKGLTNYHKTRDDYTTLGTSMLSPHIRFGQISLPAIYRALDRHTGQGKETFLKELYWREYSYYLLYHFPHLTKEPFDPKFTKFKWRKAPSDLRAWKEGRTGYPIIDAAMRQLSETGWIHNRLRMLTASFLSKHLLIDWRKGENHFAKHLIDYDPANNIAGWQWSAGQGIDMAPYFRIFNPLTQSQKFDPDGKYIRDWVEELEQIPSPQIHDPSSSNQSIKGYPIPIVDHTEARSRALLTFKKL